MNHPTHALFGRRTRALTALVATLALAACDQGASEPAPTPEEGRIVTVTLAGVDHEVDLTTLATTTVDAVEVVPLSAVVTAGWPGTALTGLQLDDLFATDGFHAAAKAFCQEILPVDGALLAQGYVDPATGNVSWDEALAHPGCLYVNDLAQIALSTPTPTPTPGRIVKVTLGGVDHEVDLATLATTTVDAVEVVSLSAVVTAGLPGTALTGLQLDDLVATDGFSAGAKAFCQAILPVDGALLAQGYVDPATGNVSWDEALGHPGCLFVNDLAQIVLSTP